MADSTRTRRWSRASWSVAVILALLAGTVSSVRQSPESPATAPPGYPAAAAEWTPRQAELLSQVVPRPACPLGDFTAEPAKDRVIVEHIRVQNGCLIVRSEAVATAEAFGRIRTLRRDPDVVAADLQPVVETEDDGPKLDDLRDLDLPADDLANLRHIDDFTAEEQQRHLWAMNELNQRAMLDDIDPTQPPTTVAVIDGDRVDRKHPEFRGVTVTVRDDDRSSNSDGKRGNHATNVASLIAAQANATGFTGLMPHSRILSAGLPSFGLPPPFDSAQERQDRSLAASIHWAMNNGARVINMSFRTQCVVDTQVWDCENQLTKAAIEAAIDNGVVVVAASGNHRDQGSPVIYPAGYDGVIGVGGHDRNGRFNESMSVNSTVDISAPGTDVMFAGFVEGKESRRCHHGYTDEHDLWCVDTGTSLAAPLVAATVAWLVNQHPEATGEQITEALFASAEPAGERISGYHRRNNEYGWGYLNPLAAREELQRVLTEERKDRKYIAFQKGQQLSVLDPVTGRVRALQYLTGPTGPNRGIVRWSPNGRYLAVLHSSGTLRWWDMATLDFTSNTQDAYDEATEVENCYCFLDFAFTDDNTIVALEGTRSTSGQHYVVHTPGRILRTFDAATGKQTATTSTPELSAIAGPGTHQGTLLAVNETEGADVGARSDLVWLDSSGREIRRVRLNDRGSVEDLVLSPDRARLAYSVVGSAFPDKELRILDTVSGTISEPSHPFGGSKTCICSFGGVRWVGATTLVTSPFHLPPYTDNDIPGLMAFRDGTWYRVDSDPLTAGAVVGTHTQVILSGQLGNILTLYVLHGRQLGAVGDLYAEPSPGHQPAASQVTQMWVSPGGKREPLLPLE